VGPASRTRRQGAQVNKQEHARKGQITRKMPRNQPIRNVMDFAGWLSESLIGGAINVVAVLARRRPLHQGGRPILRPFLAMRDAETSIRPGLAHALLLHAASP